MQLSDKIRILRKARGFSQEGLGYNLSRVNKDGISRQTISDWENGKCEPVLDNIRDLSKVLNVSFNALLDESIDLNDDETLNKVLKNLDEEKKIKVNSKFRYSIRIYDISFKDYVIFIIEGILFLTLVFSLSFASSLYAWSSIVFILTVCFSGAMLLGFIPSVIFKIRKFIKGGPGASFGELNNDYLIINTAHSATNTLYIPVDKIESMSVVGNKGKKHGNIEVSINGRARKITLNNVYDPNGLIVVFKNLNSYNENPDEIKIL